MEIRAILETDLPALAWTEKDKYPGKNKEDFQKLRKGLDFWYVAEEGSEILGRVRAMIDGPLGKPYLFALKVHPDYQNRGIGTQLLGKVETEFKKRGLNTLTLSVAKTNTRARSLYERLGYQITGERVVEWSYTYQGKTQSFTEDVFNLEKTFLPE